METEFANKRYYQLQLKPSCNLKCSYCPGLGLISEEERVHHDLIQSLKKARSGNYSAALVPCNALEQDDLQVIVETIHSFSLLPMIQINSRQLQSQKHRIEQILQWRVGVQIVWGNNISIPDNVLNLINDAAEEFHITIVAHKRMHALETFRSLPEAIKNNAYFYFPLNQGDSEEYFTVDAIYEFLKRFRVQFPGYKALPSPGVDLFDRQKQKWQEFEPQVQPIYSSPGCDIPEPSRKYSIIIPTKNAEIYIEDTLRILSQQTMDSSQYEVIIVDEGSSDDTITHCIEFARSGSADFQLKILRQQAFAVPTNDKYDHTTAVSLNLGVKNSRGEHLLFLDARSMIPRTLLLDLILHHENWDLVQPRRLILPGDIDPIMLKAMNSKELEPLAEPENPFWGQFYKNPENWNQMTDGWRYISSKNLSMRRDVFEYIGWYRKIFLHSGFEDSDLGYRAHKKGFQFFLSPEAVFEISIGKEVTSFFRKGLERQDHLSKMAKSFFQNNLDTDIYDNLRSYM